MRKFNTSISFVFVLTASVVCYGQVTPPGAGDTNLSGSDIKSRSIELQRVKKDAEKSNEKSKGKKDDKKSIGKRTPTTAPELNFNEIKEDFEQIQLINTEKIQKNAEDKQLKYSLIDEAAAEIERRAMRLKANLFSSKEKKKDEKKKKPDAVESQENADFKARIAALDNSIARFVANPMFRNLKIIEPEDSAAAEEELDLVIKLSEAVSRQASLAR